LSFIEWWKTTTLDASFGAPLDSGNGRGLYSCDDGDAVRPNAA
jgi:hypothetical protein